MINLHGHMDAFVGLYPSAQVRWPTGQLPKKLCIYLKVKLRDRSDMILMGCAGTGVDLFPCSNIQTTIQWTLVKLKKTEIKYYHSLLSCHPGGSYVLCTLQRLYSPLVDQMQQPALLCNVCDNSSGNVLIQQFIKGNFLQHTWWQGLFSPVSCSMWLKPVKLPLKRWK